MIYLLICFHNSIFLLTSVERCDIMSARKTLVKLNVEQNDDELVSCTPILS